MSRKQSTRFYEGRPVILGTRFEKKADDGSRTRDLELGKLALYQLSYVRKYAIREPFYGDSNPWVSAGALGVGAGPGTYTSIREPMMTVRSRGRPKYSAASAVMREVATKRRLRQRVMPGASPAFSSIVERK